MAEKENEQQFVMTAFSERGNKFAATVWASERKRIEDFLGAGPRPRSAGLSAQASGSTPQPENGLRVEAVKGSSVFFPCETAFSHVFIFTHP